MNQKKHDEESIEIKIGRLEENISNYEKSSNDTKSISLFDIYTKEMEDCIAILKNCDSLLNRPPFDFSNMQKTEDNYILNLKRIEELKKIGKDITLQKRIEICCELIALTQWCKEYLETLPGINKIVL